MLKLGESRDIKPINNAIHYKYILGEYILNQMSLFTYSPSILSI